VQSAGPFTLALLIQSEDQEGCGGRKPESERVRLLYSKVVLIADSEVVAAHPDTLQLVGSWLEHHGVPPLSRRHMAATGRHSAACSCQNPVFFGSSHHYVLLHDKCIIRVHTLSYRSPTGTVPHTLVQIIVQTLRLFTDTAADPAGTMVSRKHRRSRSRSRESLWRCCRTVTR
jgi:hypothetical protein